MGSICGLGHTELNRINIRKPLTGNEVRQDINKYTKIRVITSKLNHQKYTQCEES
jgi:hypothetical protein